MYRRWTFYFYLSGLFTNMYVLLSSHPEQLDDEDEENGNENENGNGHVHSTHSKVPPPMPQIPERFLNGKK